MVKCILYIEHPTQFMSMQVFSEAKVKHAFPFGAIRTPLANRLFVAENGKGGQAMRTGTMLFATGEIGVGLQTSQVTRYPLKTVIRTFQRHG